MLGLVKNRTKRALPLVLDVVSGSCGAYSFRKIRQNYTGPLATVRRSSDNTMIDIGFDSQGNLDTATLLKFVGTGNGFIRKWYDQSGTNRHLVQTTAGPQPKLVNAGVIYTLNGKPTLLFDGAASSFPLDLGITNNVPGFTINSVVKMTGNLAAGTLINFSTGTNAGNTRINIQKTTLNSCQSTGRRLDADSSQNVVTMGMGDYVMSLSVLFDYSKATLKQYTNMNLTASSSTFQTVGNSSATNSIVAALGNTNSANYFAGNLSELLLYQWALTDEHRKYIEFNQRAFYPS